MHEEFLRVFERLIKQADRSEDVMNKEIKTWPISKANNRLLTDWVFVEEFTGTLEEAYQRAAELQKLDPQWHYRIWDCR